MAANVGAETVKAPGELVLSLYAPCEDITNTVTPDLKRGNYSDGVLLRVDLACGRRRLGGSALGQVYQQLGNLPPDMDDSALFKAAFEVMQGLVKSRKLQV